MKADKNTCTTYKSTKENKNVENLTIPERKNKSLGRSIAKDTR